jgi:hypothetical protein
MTAIVSEAEARQLYFGARSIWRFAWVHARLVQSRRKPRKGVEMRTPPTP